MSARKPDDQRLRRNKPEIAWTDLPVSGRKGRVPAVPKPVVLGERGRWWWRAAWGTPSAMMWNDQGDVAQVVRRAELEDRWGESHDPKYLPEMRHLETVLCLTAKSRREERLRIVDGDGTVLEENGEPTVDELAKRRKAARVAI